MKKGVVAFAFGSPNTILSNRRIAQIATKKAWELSCTIYTQADVRIDDPVFVEHIDEDPGMPPPTLGIARGAVKWAKRHGIAQLWIVVAKPHLWRVERDLLKVISEAGTKIDLRVCEEIYQYEEDSWFCPDSTQERVRSSELWNKRERILKLMPFFIYKRMAN